MTIRLVNIISRFLAARRGPALLLPVLAFGLASCEGEIVIDERDIEPLLVVNSIMNATEREHIVAVSISDREGVHVPQSASVDLYVNGAKVASGERIVESWEAEGLTYPLHRAARYSFTATFAAGDIVRVVARSGGLSAEAEVSVPYPSAIREVKAEKSLRRYVGIGFDSGVTTTEYYRTNYDFKVTIDDIPSSADYYRLFLYREGDAYCHFGEGNDPATDEVVVRHVRDALLYDVDGDPILSDGYSDAVAGGDLNLGDLLSVGTSNWMLSFPDNLFRDKSAEVSFKVDSASVKSTGLLYIAGFYDDGRPMDAPRFVDMDVKAVVGLRTISFDEYCYLRAMNTGQTSGFDVNVLREPVSIPINVVGGLGFVGVENETFLGVDLGHVRDVPSPGQYPYGTL